MVCETPGANPNLMRQWIDQIRKKTEQAAVLLAATQGEDRVLLVAGLSRGLVERGLSAGDWVKEVAAVVGGGGGGRPDLAQAGGKHPERIPAALEKARTSSTKCSVAPAAEAGVVHAYPGQRPGCHGQNTFYSQFTSS